MKFKRIMLITLLLLAVLAIGAASAAEDVDVLAADDAGDTLAVDDAGDKQVVEAPVDEDVVETPAGDEEVVEAEENEDVLESTYASFTEEINSEYTSVCFISDYDNGINGNLTLFANDTQVYAKEVNGEDYVSIMANEIIGSFYGTYNMKIVYNGTGGNNYDKEGTVTFTTPIINKVFTPEDFQVTFPTTEVDLDKGDQTIVTFFCPEGIKERSSYIFVYYGPGEYNYHSIPLNLEDVNTYKNITWAELYQYEKGVYNISVRYSEDWENFLELGNVTINVTDNHEYTAEEIISVYTYVGTGEYEDCLADIYDEEVGGLNGVITAYANGNQIYTKTYDNYNRGGPIHAKDLTGSFNGEYTIKIEYKRADGKKFNVTQQVYFDNVVGGASIATTLTASPTSVSMEYGANKVLTVTLKDASGKAIKSQKVKIYIMGISYDLTTDSNGKAKQSLASLPPKTHNIKFEFKGAAPYTASTKTVKVVVKKATPKLSAPKKTFKKSVKTKKYTVTLKSNVNKPLAKIKITLKVNKKTYTGKTNSKGQVTFKITNLKKKGTYKASVKSAGNTYYNAKSASPKIVVK